MKSDHSPTLLNLHDAAALLQLPAQAVTAMVARGYLSADCGGEAEPELSLPDLKAFIARNADNGAGVGLFERVMASGGPRRPPVGGSKHPATTEDLLDTLIDRTDDMARRVFDIFTGVFPEAVDWPARQKASFIDHARGRFDALLAVAAQGTAVDADLFDDLRAVGASAARTHSALPQLLVILRISRDVAVQAAVEVSAGQGRTAAPALSRLITQVLPTIDRLTDALAQGYWEALIAKN
jgi:hypothetical protein